eukprot:1228371-Amphidinium_carterae.1
MAYAFMYMPLLREEAMSQEITMLHRCCACHRERDLVPHDCGSVKYVQDLPKGQKKPQMLAMQLQAPFSA